MAAAAQSVADQKSEGAKPEAFASNPTEQPKSEQQKSEGKPELLKPADPGASIEKTKSGRDLAAERERDITMLTEKEREILRKKEVEERIASIKEAALAGRKPLPASSSSSAPPQPQTQVQPQAQGSAAATAPAPAQASPTMSPALPPGVRMERRDSFLKANAQAKVLERRDSVSLIVKEVTKPKRSLFDL